MIAALFVEKSGVYSGLPDVDVWDVERDARLYAGPYPVVAHPPCSTWCQLARVNEVRYGHKVGDDGGCFAAALSLVRMYGGVLEHPAWTMAWPRFGLPTPVRGWQRSFDGSWTCEIDQCAYGHRARKATWLYYCGESDPRPMLWNRPRATAMVSYLRNHGSGRDNLPRLTKKEAKATPPAFRDALLELARSAQRRAA